MAGWQRLFGLKAKLKTQHVPCHEIRD